MIILSASGFEPAYRGPDITVVLVTPVNTGAANRSAISAPRISVMRKGKGHLLGGTI